MSRRRFHSCIDPQCSACNDRIAAREIDRDYPADQGPDHAGERMYDRFYDRMFGDA